MEVVILAALLGLIPAAIANGKGRSFAGWWIYGTLLLIVALPHALIIDPDERRLEREKLERGYKKCPFCAEIIKQEAVVCRYCGRDLPSEEQEQGEASTPVDAVIRTADEEAWDELESHNEHTWTFGIILVLALLFMVAMMILSSAV